MEDKRFYVYVYTDPRKAGTCTYEGFSFEYEPFYVGKGCGKQYMSHLIEAYNYNDVKIKTGGTHKCNKIRKIKKEIGCDPIIVKLSNQLFEQEAFNLESGLIQNIGRYDLGEGPLMNMTTGGEGTSGYVYPEYLKKIRSEAIKGDKHMLRQPGVVHWNKGKTYEEIVGRDRAIQLLQMMSERGKLLTGENNPMFGKIQTEETRQKIRDSKLGEKNYFFGKKFTLEHRNNLSESLKKCEKLKKPRPGLQGRKLSDDTKRKISTGVKKYYVNGGKKTRICGRDNHKSKAVVINSEKFDTISAAAEKLDVNSSTISYRIVKNFPGYKFANRGSNENTITTKSS